MGARACDGTKARARHTVSLFALAYVSLCELICPRGELICARTSKHARLAFVLSVLSDLLLLARACAHVLKCSRARAVHPAAVEAPQMNSYVLNEANILHWYCVFVHGFDCLAGV